MGKTKGKIVGITNAGFFRSMEFQLSLKNRKTKNMLTKIRTYTFKKSRHPKKNRFQLPKKICNFKSNIKNRLAALNQKLQAIQDISQTRNFNSR